DGVRTFMLPNLQCATPMHVGGGLALGQAGGEASHILVSAEIPAHTHTIMADAKTTATGPTPVANDSVLGVSSGHSPKGTFGVEFYGSGGPAGNLSPATSNSGGGQPHENRSPFLVLNFIIALQGIYPSQN